LLALSPSIFENSTAECLSVTRFTLGFVSHPTVIMPAMPPTEPAIDVDNALLERAKLALQSLQFEEQAARYRAAYAALLEAIADAQTGNSKPLRDWLEQRPTTPASSLGPLSETRTEPLDAPKLIQGDPKPCPDRATHAPIHSVTSTPVARDSEWSVMAHSAALRLSVWHRIDPPHPSISRPALGQPAHPANLTPSPTTPSPKKSGIPGKDSTGTRDPADQRDLEKAKAESSKDPLKPRSPPTKPTPSKPATKPSVHTASANSSTPSIAFSAALQASLVAAREKQPNARRRAWWMTPPFWVSCGLHAALLVAFAYWVITAVQPPQLLSIVASNVDSESVLTETQMEMPSDLEQTAEEAPSLPNLADTPATLSPSGLTTASEALGTVPTGPTGLTSGLASEASKAMANGSRLVPGTEFFGTKAVGNTFVYVVDCSPSMLRDGAFDEAKREILRSLQSMKPKQRFHIAFFGKEIDPLTFRGSPPEEKPVAANPENLAKTMEWIERVEIQKDGRPPIDALRAAIAMQPDGIFLLFDGDTKVKDWTTKIKELNRSDDLLSDGLPIAPIHVVHFFRDEYASEMESLAKENQGTYRFIPRPTKPNRNLK
jgi:hypothetical protein